MNILLGGIADDIAGATELASVLARSGMPVRLHLGVPQNIELHATDLSDESRPAPFEIIALSCRTSCATTAVSEATQAWHWLLGRGVRRLYWKYALSSEASANTAIGPVTDALLDAIADARADDAVVMSVHYLGSAVSACEQSPPASKLLGLLSVQTNHQTSQLSGTTLTNEQQPIREELDELAAKGTRHVVGNAVSEAELVSLVRATERFPLICGSSAQALHLPALFRVRGFLSSADEQAPTAAPSGATLVLSGSASKVTLEQVQAWPPHQLSIELNPLQLTTPEQRAAAVARVLTLLQQAKVERSALLVHATTHLDACDFIDDLSAAHVANEHVDSVLAECAAQGLNHNVRKLIVAGDQTALAVSHALDIHTLHVRHEITPGVSWCRACVSTKADANSIDLALVFKPCGAGEGQFFTQALDHIDPPKRD